jgi:hypothetical protein
MSIRQGIMRLWSVVAVLCAMLTASPASASELPTRVWDLGITNDQGSPVQVLLPNWDQISFNELPRIDQAGAINGQQWTSQLGYDISRSWQAGSRLPEILKLGDISPALQAELLSGDAIGQRTSTDVNGASLSSFPLANWQTLRHLVEVVPELGQKTAAEVLPIKELLQQKANLDQLSLDQPLSALVQNDAIGQLHLDQIDTSSFKVGDIPNLSSVQLAQFEKWGNAFINQVPQLQNLPLNRYPKSVTTIGSTVMRIDMIYGSTENQRTNTISGSYQQGFSVPCTIRDCAYLELDDMETSGRTQRSSLEGKQWISGRYQQVEGGFGVLGQLNNGKEPTGRHPYGDVFKVVVLEPNETNDTVNTALYFRICQRSPVDLGCTPYFIGPVPFFSYRVNAPLFVGELNIQQSSGESSEPTNATRPSATATGNASRKSPFDGRSFIQANPDCFNNGSPTAIADVNRLQSAIASLESAGNTQAIGPYVCAEGNCGRALGQYQLMSYNPYAVREVQQRGGQDFLNRLSQGATPSNDDLMRYFPPEAQKQAMKSSLHDLLNAASQQTDPTTGKRFVGNRLIERAAQMHFGGTASPIDSNSSDLLGQLSIKQYGQSVAQQYQALGGSRSQVCTPDVSSAPTHSLTLASMSIPSLGILIAGFCLWRGTTRRSRLVWLAMLLTAWLVALLSPTYL